MAIHKVKSKKYGYTYQVDIRYKDHLGVSQRHLKSGFVKMKDATTHEKKFLEELKLKDYKNNVIEKSFNDVFYEYMELEGKNKYANATMVNYQQTFKKHVKESIGKEPISSLKYKKIQSYFNKLSESKSKETLRNIKKIFSVTFKYALRHSYIQENPIPYLQLPKNTRRKDMVQTISDQELKMIMNEIQSINKFSPSKNTDKAIFTRKSYVMALFIGRYSGLRISEVLALKKQDFDFINMTLTVQRKVEHIGKHVAEIYLTDDLKSKNSNDTVKINKILAKQLKAWFEVNPYDLVICDGDGKLIPPATLEKRIRDVSYKLGIPFHFHMLRHTYATELMLSNANPVIVKELIRHAEVSTTMNTYSHASTDDQRKALDDVYDKELKIK